MAEARQEDGEKKRRKNRGDNLRDTHPPAKQWNAWWDGVPWLGIRYLAGVVPLWVGTWIVVPLKFDGYLAVVQCGQKRILERSMSKFLHLRNYDVICFTIYQFLWAKKGPTEPRSARSSAMNMTFQASYPGSAASEPEFYHWQPRTKSWESSVMQ